MVAEPRPEPRASSGHARNPYGEPWFTKFEPNRLVEPGDYVLMDPDLSVPPELLETSRQPNPLLEMLPALESAFHSYYAEQVERVESWGGLVVYDKAAMTHQEEAFVSYLGKRKPLLDKQDKQTAFVSELLYAKSVVERVLDIHDNQQLTTIVMLHDLDDSAGVVPEPPDGEEFIEQSGEADVDAFIFRPAYSVVLNYLYAQKGLDIKQGILSTKTQEWLFRLLPRLKALCPDVPDAFDEDLLISSKNGRFTTAMAHEIQILRHGGSIGEAYSSEIYQPYQVLSRAMDLSPEVQERDLAHYDLKPLIGVRLQQEKDYRTATVVLIDDWGLMSLYNNTHSEQQAVELTHGGAKFAPPDVAWDRALVESVYAAKHAKSGLELAKHLRHIRLRFAPPDSEWAKELRTREIEARVSRVAVRYANI